MMRRVEEGRRGKPPVVLFLSGIMKKIETNLEYMCPRCVFSFRPRTAYISFGEGNPPSPLTLIQFAI